MLFSRPRATQALIHYRYIDSLRGIAFLAVLTVHAAQATGDFKGKGIACAGIYGVQLFFLLSAVTLVRSLSVRSEVEERPIRNFLIRRVFRIGPLFWCAIAGYFLIDRAGPRFWAPGGLHAWHFISTAFFVHGWVPSSINSVVPNGWSIAVEMTFYLVLPGIWRRVSTPVRAAGAAVVAIVANILIVRLIGPHLEQALPAKQQYLLPSFFYFWFPAQACVFMIGIMAYYLVNSNRLLEYLRTGQRATLVLLLSGYALVSLVKYGHSTLLPQHFMYSLVFTAVILSLAAKPNRVLVNSLTSKIGTLSFSCYLTHFAVVEWVAGHVSSFQVAPHTPGAQFALIWAIGLALTLLVSNVTYHLVERPGIKLGNALIRVLETRTPYQASERFLAVS